MLRPNITSTALGVVIRALRVNAKLNQTAVADKLCTTISAISRLETGTRILSYIEACILVEMFRISLADLESLTRAVIDNGLDNGAALRQQLATIQTQAARVVNTQT